MSVNIAVDAARLVQEVEADVSEVDHWLTSHVGAVEQLVHELLGGYIDTHGLAAPATRDAGPPVDPAATAPEGAETPGAPGAPGSGAPGAPTAGAEGAPGGPGGTV